MPRITLARSLDEAGLAARCTPRDDIVGERIAGPGEDGAHHAGDVRHTRDDRHHDDGRHTDDRHRDRDDHRHTDGRVASRDGQERVRFVQADGPFVRYERVVEPGAVDPGDPSRRLVHETIEFELPRGTWRFLMHRPISLTLRRNPRDGRMPWWAPTQRPDPRAATVLGLLATLSLTLGYLGTLLGRTMTFAADEFGAGNTAQSVVLSTARIGALLAVVLTALADRKGRRLLLLVSLLTCIGSTALGAVTPNLAGLAASQAVNRGALAAGGVLLGIIVAEEMPAGARAYAVSLLAMTAALGAGMALWILPLADLGDQAWRILYAVPLLMIPIVVHFARLLPETLRYVRPHREVAIKGRVSRLWLLATAMFLFNIFNGPIPQFQNEFLRDERGFSAGAISLFVMVTSTPGGIGIVAGGRLAETVGRRAVAAFALVVGTILVAAQFALSGPTMWITAMLGAVVSAAVVPSVTVYWPELFPTSLRGKANGLVGMAASAGSVVGLLAIGVLADGFGSFGPTMPVVAVGPLLMAVLIVAKFPETAHRELEDINPEDRRVDDTARTPTSTRKPSTSPR